MLDLWKFRHFLGLGFVVANAQMMLYRIACDIESDLRSLDMSHIDERC